MGLTDGKIAEYRVLSLSGGGVRGLFQACFLERLESDIGELREHFDLIAATSTGAFVGLGVAAGISAAEIASLYTEHAAAIFKERTAALLRKGPRYSAAPLRAVLEQHFGDRLLEVVRIPVELRRRSPWVDDHTVTAPATS
jgi:patatin-like phospholipase/acyl hydrolase